MYLRKNKDSVITSDKNLSAKSVFQFEYQTKKTSAEIEWETEVRIRHVATGKYIYLNPSILPKNAIGKDVADVYETGLAFDGEVPLPLTLFKITATEIQGKYVTAGQSSMRLEHVLKVDNQSTTLYMTSIPKAKHTSKVRHIPQ